MSMKVPGGTPLLDKQSDPNSDKSDGTSKQASTVNDVAQPIFEEPSCIEKCCFSQAYAMTGGLCILSSSTAAIGAAVGGGAQYFCGMPTLLLTPPSLGAVAGCLYPSGYAGTSYCIEKCRSENQPEPPKEIKQ